MYFLNLIFHFQFHEDNVIVRENKFNDPGMVEIEQMPAQEKSVPILCWW